MLGIETEAKALIGGAVVKDAQAQQDVYSTVTAQLVSKRGVVAGVAALALTGVLLLSLQSHELKSDASSRSAYVANQTTYDETQVNRSYHFASIPGCDDDEIESWTCNLCTLQGVENATVRADEENQLTFVAMYDGLYDQIVFTIAGSTAKNWLQYNLNIFMADYEGADVEGAKVHAGFQDAYYELKEEYWQTVKNYIAYYPTSSILVTGYSLGASQCTFLALDLKEYLDDIGSSQKIWVNTFGMPRTGNEEFVEYFNEQIDYSWRVTYKIDFVPKVPPVELSYRHTKNEVWYYCTEPLQYKICEEEGDFECQRGTDPLMWIDDHFSYFDEWMTCNKEGKKEPTQSQCWDKPWDT
jgi:hypothetical protein